MYFLFGMEEWNKVGSLLTEVHNFRCQLTYMRMLKWKQKMVPENFLGNGSHLLNEPIKMKYKYIFVVFHNILLF